MNSSTATVAWCCGLPGSPVRENQRCRRAEEALHQWRQYLPAGWRYVRHGLCCDLGVLGDADRREYPAVGEVASLMADAGLIVLTHLFSFRTVPSGQPVKERVGHDRFIEIYVNTPLAIQNSAILKGWQKSARASGVTLPASTPFTKRLTPLCSSGDN